MAKQSWRQGRSSTPVRPKRAKPAPAAPPATRSRAMGLVGLLLFMVVLALLIAVVGWLNPVPPPQVAILTARYLSPEIPVNDFALHDAQALVHQRHLFDFMESDADSLNRDEMFGVVESLKDFRPAPFWFPWRKTTAIVYVNAIGAVLPRDAAATAEWQPCLLAEDFAVPTQSQSSGDLNVVRVRDLLESVTASHADFRLVILDCQKIEHLYPAGASDNSFVEAVRAELDRLEPSRQKGLFVLLANGPGQVSWTDARLGQSVFGYYLVRGLTGAADAQSGNADGRVNLSELFKYVSTNVDRWAQSHRADLQLPELIAFDQDPAKVTVVSIRSETGFRSPPTAQAASAADVTEQLRAAWENVYELLAESPPPYEYAPAEWNHLLATVQQAERLTRGGYFDDAQQQLAELRFRDAALVEARKQYRVQAMPCSLGMAGFLRQTEQVAASAQHRFAAEVAATTPAASAGEDGSPEDDPDMAPSAAPLPEAGLSPDSELSSFVDDAIQSRLPLPEAARLIGELRQTVGTLPIEAHFLRMLQEFRPAAADDDAALREKARRLLEIRRRAELALTASGLHLPETAPWLHAMARSADQRRRELEDRYFAAGGTGYPLGEVGPAPNSEEVEQAFRDIESVSRTMSSAMQLRNRLLFELPHLVRYCATRDWTWTPESEAEAARIPEASLKFRGEVIARTQELLRAAHAFENALRVDAASWSAEEVARHARQLEEQSIKLATLRATLFGCIQDTLVELSETNATLITRQDWRRIDDLLQLPFPADPDNPNVSTEVRLALLALSRSGVARPDERHVVIAGDRTADESRIRLAQQKQRAHQQTIAPLVAGLYALHAPQETPNAFPDRNGALQTLSKLWSEQFLSAGIGVAERQQFSIEKLMEMDAACRLLDGRLAVHFGPSWSTDLLRRRRLGELLCWQAARFAEDFWDGASGDPEPYFFAAAGALLKGALHLAGDETPRLREVASRVAELQQVAEGLRVEFDPERIVFRGTDRERVQVDVHVPANCPAGVARIAFQTADQTVELQRMTLDGAAASQNFELKRKTTTPAASQGSASLLFRGRLLPREVPIVLVDELHGVKVSYRNEREAPPQVIVRPLEIESDQLKLLFVLDCSRSMALPESSEPGANRRIVTLRNMLQRFAEETPSHALDVGVRVLGDQVVWVKGDAASEEAARKDTRNILPISAFSRAKLKSIIPGLSPKGETPLFQALLEAKNDFANITGGRKRIIVISDGADNWASFGLKPGMEELREAYRGTGIVINAIGFQVAQSEFQQLQEICRATGGTAVRASNAQQLFNQVTGLAGFLKFAIYAGNRRYPPEGEDLPGLGTDTEPLTVEPGVIDVRVLNPEGRTVAEMKDLEVSAGEKHELFYESGRLRYAPGVSYRPRVVHVDPASQAELIVLRADRRDRGLQLQLTVRNPRGTTWQPDRITLRASALGTSERRDYVVHNLRPNVAGYHFPVWNCVLEDWPQRSESAALEVLWSRSADVEPTSVPINWEQPDSVLRLRDGILLTRCVYRREPLLGEEQGVVTVTLSFPEDRLDPQEWSIGFPERIRSARETYNLKDRIYTGQFVLEGEAKPQRLILSGPEQIPRQFSAECEVPVRLGKIN